MKNISLGATKIRAVKPLKLEKLTFIVGIS